ncbi:hypothetical protein D4Q76_01100 [archaeon]|nr:MAG: hypothetical protein D4Q76_01100 [archaeon]
MPEEKIEQIVKEIKRECGIGFVADTDNGSQVMPKQYEALLNKAFDRKWRKSSASSIILSEEGRPFYPVVLSNIKKYHIRTLLMAKTVMLDITV